jgi:hypothetical protein
MPRKEATARLDDQEIRSIGWFLAKAEFLMLG